MFLKKEAEKDDLSVPQELPQLASEKYPIDKNNGPSTDSFQKNENSSEQNPQKQSTIPKELPNINFTRAKKDLPLLDETLFPAATEKPTPIEPKMPEPKNIIPETKNEKICAPINIIPQKMMIEEPKAKIEPTQHSIPQTFFSKFEEILKKDKKEIKEIFEEIDHNNLITKMKEYHDHIDKDLPYYLHSKDMLSVMNEQVIKLQVLEEEWYILRRELKSIESQATEKEKAIEKEVDKLKQIIDIIKDKPLQNSSKNRISITPDQYFRLKDGKIIRSIEELQTALTNMSSEVFYHHVNPNQNDFANWIEHVYENPVLANQLRKIKTREATIIKLRTR